MTTYTSIYEIAEAIDGGLNSEEVAQALNITASAQEILVCGLQEDFGIYVPLINDQNYLIADTDDLFSEHLKGQGAFTVCRIFTPENEMFDQEEVEVEQLGEFNDFETALAAFVSAINTAANLKAELEAFAARINQLLPDDRSVVVFDDIEDEAAYMMIVKVENGNVVEDIGYSISHSLSGTDCSYADAGDYPTIELGKTDEEVAANIAALTF
ncbi:hypothetical protein HOS33_gp251 [Erwinia phage vB_EamM_Y3]|uniref:Uncharacterized protein n=1 Tax=Erwinia phage vB_EamM_Y3 TaxID=1983553 RepID=A0A2H4IBE9_9CAUD|nr:hypothetical protein HOS33_gp251 [Erwinia phage vB_EamM_Y3]ARW58891.1 hypothetical protein Y3_251 [Erwinia phage vB_EamM_Y3]